MTREPSPKRCCAVYTRKSSEEGLEQNFNSLDAQREACEAYIKSQAGEGWRLIKAAYEDGGISGGTMERPGLQGLLADIKLGKIDVVVVYKVDRLTRSLMDFAKIVEVFDAHGVSFVSITQAFNTTTSMGRLTLNVLLSFAQFEREVTGERIRDKIAASKAKGMWMGGVVPLGYDAKDRELVVNAAEAEQVVGIFRRYLELGSVHALEAELDRQGVRSKAWLTRAGRAMGGLRFSRGALFHLLKNPHYLGQIRHHDRVHPGLHPPIVPADLFDAVQAQLAANRVRRTQRGAERQQACLAGLLFDEQGHPLSPSFSTGRGHRRYEYYLRKQSARCASEPPLRLPRAPLEDYVLEQLRRLAQRETADLPTALAPVLRIEVRAASVEFVLNASALFGDRNRELEFGALQRRLQAGERLAQEGQDQLRVSLPVRMCFRGGRTWLVGAAPTPGLSRPKANPTLVRALRLAHATLRRMNASPLESSPFRKATPPPVNTYLIRVMKLAFLAPDIQLEILAGRQPQTLSLKALLEGDIPTSWPDQRRWLHGAISPSAAKR